MPATEPQKEVFAEAAQDWDLEKLYADLGKAKKIWDPAKKRGLTDVEKEYLRGLLCDYSPNKMAATLAKELGGIRKALTNTIYRYVEVLVERPANSLSNWRDVADWLEEKYKKDKSQPADYNLDCHRPPDISRFQGRVRELEELKKWIVNDDCQLAAILGIGGIGKSSLAAKLAEEEEIKSEFEVIWYSLRHAPLFCEMVGDLLQCLCQSNISKLPKTKTGEGGKMTSCASEVSQLMAILRDRRCLLILDDLETVMGSGQLAGYYRPGYEDYGEFLKQVVEFSLRSCLLVTSREKPIEILTLAGDSVRCQQLGGLDEESAQAILAERGLSASKPNISALIQLYSSHPTALKIATATIKEVFDGNTSLFLSKSTLIVGDALGQLLSEQFDRLSELEREIIYWLAIESVESASISLSQVQERIWHSVSGTDLVGAMGSLRRRSLIEKYPSPSEETPPEEPLFTLQPVLRKYVLNRFIRIVREDIRAVLLDNGELEKLGCLRSHALVSDRSPAEIQAIQKRTILARVQGELPSVVGGSASIKEQLQQLLSSLADYSALRLGYAPSNLRLLLAALEV